MAIFSLSYQCSVKQKHTTAQKISLPPPRNSLAFSSKDGKVNTRADMSVHRPTATTDAVSSSHKGETSKQATSCSTVVDLLILNFTFSQYPYKCHSILLYNYSYITKSKMTPYDSPHQWHHYAFKCECEQLHTQTASNILS